MIKSVKKFPRIKPNYIKDEKGKVVQIFLDMKSYESMLGRIQEYEKIIKADKSKKK